MRILAFSFVVATAFQTMSLLSEENARSAWNIPSCTKGKVKGTLINTGVLRYRVLERTIVRKVSDVDYQEYRVFLNRNSKEALKLFWGVNASPFPLQADVEASAKYEHRRIKLPNGAEGIDARGTMTIQGTDQLWRSAGVTGEFACYEDASAEGAAYFNSIIDSVCYQSH
jgi:hypothetical protein